MTIFSTALGKMSTALDIAIKNGMNFSVQVVPLDENYSFPDDNDVFEFTEEFVKAKLQYKKLNDKALEGMKRGWVKKHGPDVPFELKKQPSEILAVFIAPSNEQIHLFYSVPKTMTFHVPESHYEDKWDFGNRTIYYGPIKSPVESTIFKHADQLMSDIMEQLKIQGIYEDDDSDDELVFCLNDLDD